MEITISHSMRALRRQRCVVQERDFLNKIGELFKKDSQGSYSCYLKFIYFIPLFDVKCPLKGDFMITPQYFSPKMGKCCLRRFLNIVIVY